MFSATHICAGIVLSEQNGSDVFAQNVVLINARLDSFLSINTGASMRLSAADLGRPQQDIFGISIGKKIR